MIECVFEHYENITRHSDSHGKNITHVSVGAGNVHHGTFVAIAKHIMHPKYKPKGRPSNNLDIGLVFLLENLTYGKNVQPLLLMEVYKRIPNGALVTITGRGINSKSERGSKGHNLYAAQMRIIDNRQCQERLNRSYAGLSRRPRRVGPNLVCAFATAKATCPGDSGSGLVYGGQVVGVVAWGRGCRYGPYPSVFARVDKALPWIESEIRRYYKSNNGTV